MASKTTVSLVDDLDGTDATQEVPFGLDGVTYLIDLSDDNAERLREILGEYIPHARRLHGRKQPIRRVGTSTYVGSVFRSGTGSAPAPATVVREWARNNGIEMPDRGRIPNTVMDAFNAAEDEADTAHGDKPGPRPALAGIPVFSNQPTNPGRRAGTAGMTTGTATGAARTRQRATNKAKATGTEPAPTKTKTRKTRKTTSG